MSSSASTGWTGRSSTSSSAPTRTRSSANAIGWSSSPRYSRTILPCTRPGFAPPSSWPSTPICIGLRRSAACTSSTSARTESSLPFLPRRRNSGIFACACRAASSSESACAASVNSVTSTFSTAGRARRIFESGISMRKLAGVIVQTNLAGRERCHVSPTHKTSLEVELRRPRGHEEVAATPRASRRGALHRR